MVRYLFYTIGDLTYQSPLVKKQKTEGCGHMTYSTIEIDISLHECPILSYHLTLQYSSLLTVRQL